MRLKELWREFTGVDPVGWNEDFFELGGHSLVALRLLARVEKEFKTTVSLHDFAQAATIGGLAKLIREARPGRPAAIIPLNNQGTGPAIYCLGPVGGDVYSLRFLAAALGPRAEILRASAAAGQAERVVRLVDRSGGRLLCRGTNGLPAGRSVCCGRILRRGHDCPGDRATASGGRENRRPALRHRWRSLQHGRGDARVESSPLLEVSLQFAPFHLGRPDEEFLGQAPCPQARRQGPLAEEGAGVQLCGWKGTLTAPGLTAFWIRRNIPKHTFNI